MKDRMNPYTRIRVPRTSRGTVARSFLSTRTIVTVMDERKNAGIENMGGLGERYFKFITSLRGEKRDLKGMRRI